MTEQRKQIAIVLDEWDLHYLIQSLGAGINDAIAYTDRGGDLNVNEIEELADMARLHGRLIEAEMQVA